MHLTKHHGLGNDFLVALAELNPGMVPDPAVAVRLLDRRRGVGADGFLWGVAAEDPADDVGMVLHQPDGSEAEISGNGIRCLAQAVLRATGRDSGELRVGTVAGSRRIVVTATAEPCTVMVEVDMGQVGEGRPVPRAVTAAWGERIASLEVGNPHLVILVDPSMGVDPAVAGPEVESQVDGGVNVHFLSLDGPDTIRLFHWERGVGVTEACGSGATVGAFAANRWGLVGSTVRVVMPGGSAEVTVGPTVTLTGPATFVAEVVTP